MWHVSSRSVVATLRTAIHLLLTYLLSLQTGQWPHTLATYHQHDNAPSWSTTLNKIPQFRCLGNTTPIKMRALLRPYARAERRKNSDKKLHRRAQNCSRTKNVLSTNEGWQKLSVCVCVNVLTILLDVTYATDVVASQIPSASISFCEGALVRDTWWCRQCRAGKCATGRCP